MFNHQSGKGPQKMVFGRAKPDTAPKTSWWIAATREEFEQNYREHQARIIANDAPVPTAKEHGSGRQQAGARKVNLMLATVGMEPVRDE